MQFKKDIWTALCVPGETMKKYEPLSLLRLPLVTACALAGAAPADARAGQSSPPALGEPDAVRC